MQLLDVNALIALADPLHMHHETVARWFAQNHHAGWATCPLTENGFIRIVGHPNYPEGPGTAAAARRLLNALREQPGHQFWSDTLSLCDATRFRSLPGARDLTDFYLLALAVEHDARLATLDRRFDPSTLPGGPAACLLIGNSR
jgi:toxin-antitoxin system PIN domain toxin